jgi:hypothetical protein
MKNSLIYLLIFCSSINLFAAEQPSVGWDTWRQLNELYNAKKFTEGHAFVSKDFLAKLKKKSSPMQRNPFFPFGNAKFKKEIVVGKYLFLHILWSNKEKPITIIFIKEENKWKFDFLAFAHFDKIKEAKQSFKNLQIRQNTIHIKGQIKQLGGLVANYFADGSKKVIPEWQAIGIEPKKLSYINPETGEKEKLILNKGIKYTYSSEIMLAATEKPIAGQYIIVWLDGHVTSMDHKEFIEKATKSGFLKTEVPSI